jgi:CheY-like chemotaxis protein
MSDAANKVILIVEDNKPLLEIMAFTLSGANTGYPVVTAENYQDAKTHLDKGNVAAVVTDNNFPKTPDGYAEDNQGIELVRYIRSSPSTKDIPILMQSGTLDQAVIHELAVASGAAVEPAYKKNDITRIDHKLEAVKKGMPLHKIVADLLHRNNLGPPQDPSGGKQSGIIHIF